MNVRAESKMAILVAGASGATGRHLVEQLLTMDQKIKVIIRSPEKLPESWNNDDRLTIIHGNVLEMSRKELQEHIKNCGAIASCLGHNLTWKGIYGKPRMLVTDSVRLLAEAVQVMKSIRSVKFVLMNTTGNRNLDLHEPVTMGHKTVIGLLRLLLPPQLDNEKAANYLRVQIGQHHPNIEWVAVRPDTLVNEDHVTDYDVHASPIRDPIFNAGKTSRINVGHFMAKLISDQQTWVRWKGQMPVIYNRR